jgi:hypothetical protein
VATESESVSVDPHTLGPQLAKPSHGFEAHKGQLIVISAYHGKRCLDPLQVGDYFRELLRRIGVNRTQIERIACNTDQPVAG